MIRFDGTIVGEVPSVRPYEDWESQGVVRAIEGTVDRVDAWLVECRQPNAAQAASPVPHRDLIFVRVFGSDGEYGTGFTSTVGTGGYAVLEHVRRDLVDHVIGQSAFRPEAVWDQLFWATHGTVRGAITGLAMSAVDIALWDLRGKTLGLSLWEMTGGHRRRVPAYTADGGWLDATVDELTDSAVRSVADGWAGIKMKIGKPSVSEDRARVEAVRAAIGPNVDLMIDGNQALTVSDALRLAKMLEPLDIRWFEEPLPADDVGGHALLASSTSIPIAFGESLYTLGQFREYLDAGIRGILQPDVTRVGGVTPWLKIAHLAEAFNTQVAPHVRTEISASLAAAVPNGLYVEHHAILESLATSCVEIVGGLASVPTLPGLGIQWDEAMLDTRRAG